MAHELWEHLRDEDRDSGCIHDYLAAGCQDGLGSYEQRSHNWVSNDTAASHSLQAEVTGQQIATTMKEDDIQDAPTPPIDVPYQDRHGLHYPHRQHVDNSDGEGEYFNGRQTSIHFAPRVRTQDGEQPKLEEKLPKLRVRTRSIGKSLMEQMAKRKGISDTDGNSSQLALRSERSAVAKATPLWNAVSEEAVETTPPLSDSHKGSSPPLDAPPTPQEQPADVYGSPIAVSPISPWPSSQSPASASSSWYNRKYGSRPASIRRASRRATATSTSASPASNFLRQYSISSTPILQPDSEGAEIGDYVLGREIGSGGFSIVREAFSASSPSVTPTLAVKIVRKRVRGSSETENEVLQAQFEHEIALWRCLNHDNVLELKDVHTNSIATFAFMPLIRGGSLWDIVKSTKGQGLDIRKARTYAAQVAEALRYLHEDVRIVHRDIKLENCLLDTSRNSNYGGHDDYLGGPAVPKVVLADFGLADYMLTSGPTEATDDFAASSQLQNSPRSAASDLGDDRSAGPPGSLQYAAPELLYTNKTPPLSPRVDVWAYGVLLYALVTSRLPFQHGFAPKLAESIKAGEWDRGLLDQKVKQGVKGVQGVESNGRDVKEKHECGHKPGIMRNEDWARSCHTILVTDAVDVEDVSKLVDGCLQTKPKERWNIRQIIESSWLAVERSEGRVV